MAQRKIQLLRSQTVYQDLDAARQSLDLTFANTAGLGDGEIVLADEISPDCMRLWDAKTNDHLDKDRFRRDLGDVMGAYEEIYARLQKLN